MTTLLQHDDPAPVELINPDSELPIVLVCEHAGRTIPGQLGDLGIGEEDLAAHIAWDIGAGAVTRELAGLLGVTAVLQRYSRLVIDCNRPPEAPDSIPPISHGIHIAGNKGLTEHQRAQRVAEVFTPFDQALNTELTRLPRTAAFAVHSFTPTSEGQQRPWDISFLFRHDTTTSQTLAESLKARYPQLTIGMNAPYWVDDESDWFVPRFGETMKLKHSLIEIRNDHLRTSDGQHRWSQLLASLINDFLQHR